MSSHAGDSFEEVFARFEEDQEFLKADRMIKPYYDLIVEIVKRRLHLGLTQKDLAKKAKTFQSRISKIESGEHDIRLSTLIQIAEALDTEVSIHLLPLEEIRYISSPNQEYQSIPSVSIPRSDPPENILEFLESEAEEVSITQVPA